MFTKFRFNFIYTIILITFTSTSFGETLNFKNLVIKDFWIKPSIGNHKITSGYLIIQNNSNFDERLISVTSNFSKKTELHQMDVKNDIMIMKKLVKGLIIRAKSETVLKPGGYHLMFLNLNGPVKITNSYKVNLFFENSGSFVVNIPVLDKKLKNNGHKH